MKRAVRKAVRSGSGGVSDRAAPRDREHPTVRRDETTKRDRSEDTYDALRKVPGGPSNTAAIA